MTVNPVSAQENASTVPLVFKMPFDTTFVFSNPVAHRVQTLRRNGKCKEGISLIDSVLAADPDNVSVKVQKIYILLRLKAFDIDTAEQLYKEVYQYMSPEERKYVEPTLLFYKSIGTRSFVRVAERYTELIRLYPGDPLLYYNRALCNIRRGRFEVVEKDLKKTLELAPSDVQALYAYGFACNWLGMSKKGIILFDQAEQLMDQQVFEEGIYEKGLFRWRASLNFHLSKNTDAASDNEKATGYIQNAMHPNLWWKE